VRYIILLLFFAVTLSAQTVELSALNYDGDWQTRDAAFLADVQAMLNNHVKSADLVLLYHYSYAINDSSISFVDSEDSLKVVERYFNLTKSGVTECPVELIWATISKHSPAIVKKAVYNGWKGGPWDKKITALSTKDTRGLKLGLEYRDAVNKAQKADIKLKRKDAWAKVKAEKKAEKEKNEPRPVIDSGYGVFRHSCGGAY
jgi:hypothetical protein